MYVSMYITLRNANFLYAVCPGSTVCACGHTIVVTVGAQCMSTRVWWCTTRMMDNRPYQGWRRLYVGAIKGQSLYTFLLYSYVQQTLDRPMHLMWWVNTHITYCNFWRLVQCWRPSARVWAPATPMLFQFRLHVWTTIHTGYQDL